ncbi:hypothetical protein Dimus_018783 [Dionaea muscipula]
MVDVYKKYCWDESIEGSVRAAFEKFRVDAETATRSSSSRTEADIWREATRGPKHSRWYGFGSQEQASALCLTLTDTSSPSVQSTAQPTQPQSSQTMMEEIVRVV